MRAVVVIALSFACALGCGARSGLLSVEVAADVDASIDVGDTSVVVRDSAVRRDVAVDTGPRCVPQTDALAAKIVPAVGSCTTVVRLARVGGAITGYKMICGGYSAIDEATAAKKSQADTGIGLSGCFVATSITGSKPADDFVFFQPASAAACACCGDGWVTAVSARTGLTLLGGDVTLGDGRGLVYPKDFDPPSDLGAGCGSRLPLPPVRGFDLTKMGAPGTKPAPLDAPIMESLMRSIWSTALPEALARKHYLFDAVVLLYTPHGAEPLDAEWIVLLNTGWLE